MALAGLNVLHYAPGLLSWSWIRFYGRGQCWTTCLIKISVALFPLAQFHWFKQGSIVRSSSSVRYWIGNLYLYREDNWERALFFNAALKTIIRDTEQGHDTTEQHNKTKRSQGPRINTRLWEMYSRHRAHLLPQSWTQVQALESRRVSILIPGRKIANVYLCYIAAILILLSALKVWDCEWMYKWAPLQHVSLS